MDPTSLPTDNLYKFLALGSLLSLGFFWYSVSKRLSAIRDRRHILRIRFEANHLSITHLGEQHSQAYEAKAPDKAAEIRVKFGEQMVESKRIEFEETRLAELAKEAENLAKAFRVIVPFLVTTMLLGFGLWYFRSQRYQDEGTLLTLREQRAKTESAELQLQEARKKKPAPPATTSAQPRTVILSPASPSATVPPPPAAAATPAPP
jgi:hypothetical protein